MADEKAAFAKKLEDAAKAADARRSAERGAEQSAQQSGQPTPPPQNAAPTKLGGDTPWNFYFSPKQFLGQFFKFGLIGASIYTAGTLMDPLKKIAVLAKDATVYAVKAPFAIANKFPGWKGKTAALSLAGLEAFGAVSGGLKVQDAYQNTDFPDNFSEAVSVVTSNLTDEKATNIALIGGLAGFAVRAAAHFNDDGGRATPTERILNDLTTIWGDAVDWAVDMNEKIPPSSESEQPLRNQMGYADYVQVCRAVSTTPGKATDQYGKDHDIEIVPDFLKKDMENGTVAKWNNYLDDEFNAMRADPDSPLNRAIKDAVRDNKKVVQIQIPQYNDPDKKIRVIARAYAVCPDHGNIRYGDTRYHASQWIENGKGLYPSNVTPLTLPKKGF